MMGTHEKHAPAPLDPSAWAGHTPGPWCARLNIHDQPIVGSASHGLVPIRTAFREDAFTGPEGASNRSAHTDAELAANAALIAAAPQLAAEREALRKYVATVARMLRDGEDNDGTPYEQSIDDAYETLARLIDDARALLERIKG